MGPCPEPHVERQVLASARPAPGRKPRFEYRKPFPTEPEVGERGAEVPERRLSFLLEFIPCLSAFFPSSHTFEIFFDMPESSSSSQEISLKR
ncbi:hypothetical protein R6Z07F_013660 [Ovis aries]